MQEGKTGLKIGARERRKRKTERYGSSGIDNGHEKWNQSCVQRESVKEVCPLPK
jgi:hypothetical protein